ncbi:enoyl-CoA hydratase-related protein [Halanaerobium sp.]|uniref:enoyl-CoA hydratase-related protein n=1 Tax=Halanaerobium sp. TaxID=1895664 RepID=UPI00268451E2
MSYNNLNLEVENSLAILKINRPKALNALNKETLKEIDLVIEDLNKNEAVKVVIISGEGEKAFAAGADISEMKDMNVQEAKEFSLLGHRVFNEIENSPKIFIAAINGYALGGGCELALACDLRIAAENAKFGQPEISLGIIPGFGGTQRLTKIIGKPKALELVLTAKNINAKKAAELKLVNQVFETDDVITQAKSLAEEIAEKSAPIISFAKEAVNFALEHPATEGSKYEANLFSNCFSTADQKEGMQAFLEKRKAEFKNE